MSRLAWHVGDRTVLAMTCRQCGKLKPGHLFPRYSRSFRDRMAYVSRRCSKCRIGYLERSIGRSKSLRPPPDLDAHVHGVPA